MSIAVYTVGTYCSTASYGAWGLAESVLYVGRVLCFFFLFSIYITFHFILCFIFVLLCVYVCVYMCVCVYAIALTTGCGFAWDKFFYISKNICFFFFLG